ncbi:TonB-dependent vitamin B12 receptor [Thiobacillus denitrificans]|uniref:Ligand-gated channel protein n=1 Tax=Thiobacillus denitrificans TaxID=36861 RepID=A0A125BCG7_THIDE|nr:TonB-dependent vitamin B12 receptor [Thiobacillus denitrificans]KVW95447.1 ligand-gated channel protein [Thiobacillus denitrificans]
MRQTTLALALGVAFIPFAYAETLPEFVGETIVVTPTRTAQTVDDSLASVSVITRSDIERLQARSLADVLQGMVGVTLANNGGEGKGTSIFLRGANSDHVLVLIDGVKIGSATTGTAAFQDFPMHLIERIEVVRGPVSSLYGSEAIGGVIQIFTRKGGGALTPRASLTVGSNNTRGATAGLSGGGEQGWFNAGVAHTRTDGFNACKGLPGVACFTNEPDNDGYRNTAFTLRGGYRFAPGSELDLHALRAQGDNEFDGTFQNQSEFVQQVIGAGITHRFNEAWRVKLSAGQGRDESDNFKNGVYSSTFNTRRNSASMQNDFSLGRDHLLTLGLDRQEDHVRSNAAYAVTRRDTTGVFAEYQGQWDKHRVQLALRGDDNSQFGRHTTGNVAWGYPVMTNLDLRLAYGTAFKAPTFNQLYYPGFGNPNLRSETSRNIELGLGGRLSGGRWSATLFDNRISDLIAGFPPANINRAEIRGLELAANRRFGAWDAAVNLTLQDPENASSGANQGKVLPRRAQESLRIDIDRRLGVWRLGATLRGEGERFDNESNTRRMAGYALLDLRAEYRLAAAWSLGARLENLFDVDYETAFGYNQPGRGAYLTVRYQPK